MIICNVVGQILMSVRRPAGREDTIVIATHSAGTQTASMCVYVSLATFRLTPTDVTVRKVQELGVD